MKLCVMACDASEVWIHVQNRDEDCPVVILPDHAVKDIRHIENMAVQIGREFSKSFSKLVVLLVRAHQPAKSAAKQLAA